MNEVWYPGSIMVFPTQIFLWDVQSAADIRAHSFDIVEFIKPFPRHVIIGTGKDYVELPDQYFERFRKNKIKVDVVPTVTNIFSNPKSSKHAPHLMCALKTT